MRLLHLALLWSEFYVSRTNLSGQSGLVHGLNKAFLPLISTASTALCFVNLVTKYHGCDMLWLLNLS